MPSYPSVTNSRFPKVFEHQIVKLFMAINANELIALVSALVSIPTSIIVFFVSQNYLIERNRRRLMRRIIGQIRVITISTHKISNFSRYVDRVRSIKTLISFALVFALIFIGSYVVTTPSKILIFWTSASIAYLIVIIMVFELPKIVLKSPGKRPYKFIFEEYPSDYATGLIAFVLAFLLLVTPIAHDLGESSYFYNTIFSLIIVIFGVALVPYLFYILGTRDLEYVPADIVSELLTFFLKKGSDYIVTTPFLIVTLVGGNQVQGTINGLEKDVLILSEGESRKYVTWESIASFSISQSRPSSK